jgi:hypothetical protein
MLYHHQPLIRFFRRIPMARKVAEPVKRGRGRPPKEAEPVKRGRGRPRKEAEPVKMSRKVKVKPGKKKVTGRGAPGVPKSEAHRAAISAALTKYWKSKSAAHRRVKKVAVRKTRATHHANGRKIRSDVGGTRAPRKKQTAKARKDESRAGKRNGPKASKAHKDESRAGKRNGKMAEKPKLPFRARG